MSPGAGACTSPSAVGQNLAVPTWWGENLQGAGRYPITLKSAPHKVTAHSMTFDDLS